MNAAAAQAPMTDLSLEQRMRLVACDAGALELFFERYFDAVHGYVRRLVREEHLAEDLTQDVFMHVHRSIRSYDPTRALSPWVFTIATNKVRDHWRSRAHGERKRERPVDDDPDHEHAGGVTPDHALEAGELADAVASAVAALPESMRETFVLRYYEGLSFEAIGEISGRSEVAVRKRYSRALEELRRQLADHISSREGGDSESTRSHDGGGHEL